MSPNGSNVFTVLVHQSLSHQSIIMPDFLLFLTCLASAFFSTFVASSMAASSTAVAGASCASCSAAAAAMRCLWSAFFWCFFVRTPLTLDTRTLL